MVPIVVIDNVFHVLLDFGTGIQHLLLEFSVDEVGFLQVHALLLLLDLLILLPKGNDALNDAKILIRILILKLLHLLHPLVVINSVTHLMKPLSKIANLF